MTETSNPQQVLDTLSSSLLHSPHLGRSLVSGQTVRVLAVGGVSVGSVWDTFPGLPDAPASAKHLLYYYLSGRPEDKSDEWFDLDEGKAHIRFQYHTATESNLWDFTFSEELKKAATASESAFLTQTMKAFDKTKADLAGLRRQLEQHKANVDKCINAQKA